ncbi:hypothetical protein HID58_062990 [Brassica napus]|uniref:Uncharacterized protein n=2 Tax=Brassica TaxID=3705 RepID=A0ABQ8A305_BRANA|nr:hypothetical protein HID58_062990 [Brassica napus]VDD15090.1 unnamed protein product [Brassica oleracea]
MEAQWGEPLVHEVCSPPRDQSQTGVAWKEEPNPFHSMHAPDHRCQSGGVCTPDHLISTTSVSNILNILEMSTILSDNHLKGWRHSLSYHTWKKSLTPVDTNHLFSRIPI